jgi:CRISPR-associated endonuclease/helicase Cas3
LNKSPSPHILAHCMIIRAGHSQAFIELLLGITKGKNELSGSMAQLEKLPGFWGKIRIHDEKDSSFISWLPLELHCLDVALVFRALVSMPVIRRSLEAAARTQLRDEQLDRLAVLALLHDVGKANLGFQYKVFDPRAPKAGHIRELAPLLFEPDLNSSFAAAIELDSMKGWFDPEEQMDGFFIASWSHHGRPARFDPDQRADNNYYQARDHWWRPHGSFDPVDAIARISASAKQFFPNAFRKEAKPIPATPALQHRFAGLLMLADWLGSDENYFPIGSDENRAERGQRAAFDILEAVGIDVTASRKALSRGYCDFEHWFPMFKPKPLQAAIDDLDVKADRYRLLIAESETGSGKTEAALTWFFKLFAAGKVDSLYFALPTRVAAGELFDRIVETIHRIFPEDCHPSVVLAVPGYNGSDTHPGAGILPDESTRMQDDERAASRDKLWAAERPKRFLAAAVGVGTIDQALLSIVQNSHAHLRSVCLDRSLLVVDEVHASDSYMRYLLRALLHHHVGIGGYAMLLSATLGSPARIEFLEAVGSKTPSPSFDEAIQTPYPSLIDREGNIQTLNNTEAQLKKVYFETAKHMFDPQGIADRVLQALSSGARVIIIMNTVLRAIKMQRELETDKRFACDWFFRCNEVVCPHHGRFAPVDRSILDKAVRSRFGKDSAAGPQLIIGTQTLEQSLDLDADLLITDLCPADVLLQRVGRLHRHKRYRPPGFETARCIVLLPETGDLEEFIDEKGNVARNASRAGLGSVYEDLRILELTLRMLIEKPEIEIPRDNRWLVDGATHPERMALFDSERWKRHAMNVEGIGYAGDTQAHGAIIRYDVDFTDLVFSELNNRSRTRLGLDSLQLPLDRPIESPFGETLKEMIIPGHMAPEDKEEQKIIVLDSSKAGESIDLSFGEKVYHYSRLGLEVER